MYINEGSQVILIVIGRSKSFDFEYPEADQTKEIHDATNLFYLLLVSKHTEHTSYQYNKLHSGKVRTWEYSGEWICWKIRDHGGENAAGNRIIESSLKEQERAFI